MSIGKKTEKRKKKKKEKRKKKKEKCCGNYADEKFKKFKSLKVQNVVKET